MTETSKRLAKEACRLFDRDELPMFLTVSPDDFAILQAEAGDPKPGEALGLQGPFGFVGVKSEPGEPSEKARMEADLILQGREELAVMMRAGQREFVRHLRAKGAIPHPAAPTQGAVMSENYEHTFSLTPGEMVHIGGIPYLVAQDGRLTGGTDPGYARALRDEGNISPASHQPSPASGTSSPPTPARPA